MFHRIPPYFEMKKDIFMESMLCEKNFERDSVRINKRGKIGGRLFGLQCRSESLSSLSLSLSLSRHSYPYTCDEGMKGFTLFSVADAGTFEI